MKRTIFLTLAICSVVLTGCAAEPLPRPVEVRTQTVEVAVRAPCPDPVERERLRALRPARLADQPMPATPRERVGKTSAQLGRYEAVGGWADQVDAALDRCQRPRFTVRGLPTMMPVETSFFKCQYRSKRISTIGVHLATADTALARRCRRWQVFHAHAEKYSGDSSGILVPWFVSQEVV